MNGHSSCYYGNTAHHHHIISSSIVFGASATWDLAFQSTRAEQRYFEM